MNRSEEESIKITKVTEPISVGYHFKRFAAKHCSKEEISTCIGIVCSELASNIVNHAGDGTIRCRIIGSGRKKEIEIVAEDKGRGIENVELALKDGYTDEGPIFQEGEPFTNPSMGTGLPAIKRLMDEVEIKSSKGKGTIIIARKEIS